MHRRYLDAPGKPCPPRAAGELGGESLAADGKFIAAFGDYTALPTGAARFIPVRGDDTKLKLAPDAVLEAFAACGLKPPSITGIPDRVDAQTPPNKAGRGEEQRRPDCLPGALRS